MQPIEIIVIISVIVVLLLVIVGSSFKKAKAKKNGTSGCGGCSGCRHASSCASAVQSEKPSEEDVKSIDETNLDEVTSNNQLHPNVILDESELKPDTSSALSENSEINIK